MIIQNSPIMGTAHVKECINNCLAVGGTTSPAAPSATTDSTDALFAELDVNLTLLDLSPLMMNCLLSVDLERPRIRLELKRDSRDVRWHCIERMEGASRMLMLTS